MALIHPESRCGLCGEKLWGRQVFATSGGFLPPSAPLWEYCDAGIHWECYALWPDRPRFAQAWLDVQVGWEPFDPHWGAVLLHPLVFCELNRGGDTVRICLAATATEYCISLSDWEAFPEAAIASEPLTRWETEALLEMAPIVREALPTADAIRGRFDAAAKERLWQAERAEEEARESAREAILEAQHQACLALEQSIQAREACCPHCQVALDQARFVCSQPHRKWFFVCPACGRSFRPSDYPDAVPIPCPRCEGPAGPLPRICTVCKRSLRAEATG